MWQFFERCDAPARAVSASAKNLSMMSRVSGAMGVMGAVRGVQEVRWVREVRVLADNEKCADDYTDYRHRHSDLQANDPSELALHSYSEAFNPPSQGFHFGL